MPITNFPRLPNVNDNTFDVCVLWFLNALVKTCFIVPYSALKTPQNSSAKVGCDKTQSSSLKHSHRHSVKQKSYTRRF